MSELQSDSIESDLTEQSVIENQNDGVDLATTSEAEHEEKPQVDDEVAKQEAINKAINKKHFEAKQAERERDEARAKLAELQKAEQERQAATVGNIPPAPDPFDDDYEVKAMAREDAIRKQASFEAENQVLLQQQQRQQQEQAQAKAVAQSEAITAYAAKANELGVKQDELQAAGNTVAQYGLSDDLIMHILKDSEGPLITKHLAANPQEGFQLASMSPYAVGSFLDGIKQKASALKPKTTEAPPPAERLSGNGVDTNKGQFHHIGGAKFE